MKDSNGKETSREVAPVQRDPADKYKVTVLPKEERYNINQDPKSDRPIVTKKEGE